MNGGFATNVMSALYDHAKQYDDEHTSHVTERWKLHGNISRNGYGNAIIGRYGGCFEEGIRGLCVKERIISRGLDAPVKFAPTLEVRKGNARYRMMTHKYRGSIVVLSISKSVKPNQEQKEMTSRFQQGILCRY